MDEIAADESKLLNTTADLSKLEAALDEGKETLMASENNTSRDGNNEAELSKEHRGTVADPTQWDDNEAVVVGNGAASPKHTHNMKRKRKKRKKHPPTYTCRTEVKESSIAGAGLGLYLLEDALAGERVAKYSGTPLNAAEIAKSKSRYLFEVHKDLALDAEAKDNFKGRYINDGRHSGREVNVRFGARRATSICKLTGKQWVSVFAIKDIPSGTELLVDYGDAYWDGAEGGQPMMMICSPSMTAGTVMETLKKWRM